MSLMAMSASRSSVFTFESSVHSSHVLRCLDEQRRRDTFCDVTVLAEGKSFRAHRSVLASCSEYFSHRISTLTQHGAVISLPPEVTAAAFELLLQFAYTSKLLFGKDNVLDVQNSASILGFRDLDEACFEFLLPKFFSSTKASFPRKTCCKKKCKRRLSKEDCGIDSDDALLGEKEAKPVADSPIQQEVAWHCNKSVNGETGSQNSASTPTPERVKNDFIQCPKYRKFQLACGKESCIVNKSLQNTAKVIRDVCALSCMPCSSTKKGNNETEMDLHGISTSNSTRPGKDAADDVRKTEKSDKKAEEARVVTKDERGGKCDENEREADVLRARDGMEQASGFGALDRSNVKAGSSSTALGARSGYHCPLRALDESNDVTRSLGQEMTGMEIKERTNTRECGAIEPVSNHLKAEEQKEAEGEEAEDELEGRPNGGQTGTGTRGTQRIYTEAGEKPLRFDMCSSQSNIHDLDVGSSSDTGSERVANVPSERTRPGSSGARCPFFQDGDQGKCLWKGPALSECEGASQSGVSSLNSGEDGDSETETEGDSESYARERARQVQLPFPVDWIVELTRNDFQQLLKQQVFTPEQLEFVHDMRRRSKNRLAAQRCRKRKLDCIHNLQCEIQKLRTEREKLLMEKSQLSQMKMNTCHTVSALCHRVCNEANLQPEQIQVLAKYTSSDCPLASFFPYIDALLSQPGLPVETDGSGMAVEEASPTSSGDGVTEDGQYSP